MIGDHGYKKRLLLTKFFALVLKKFQSGEKENILICVYLENEWINIQIIKISL